MSEKPTYDELEQRVKELQREVSECSRAAEELRREQSIFIGGPVVVFRWLATKNWPAAYVSPNVTQVGYEADDFVSGRRLYTHIIHREDLDRVLSEVEEYSESGVPFYEQEYRIIQADGEMRWVHDFTIVRRNDQREITHYDGYILDITDRKHAEEELRASEERYGTLSEASFEGILIHDKGRILTTNTRFAEMYGYESAELVGMDALTLIAPVHRDTVRNHIASGFEGPYETLGLRKDGSTFLTEIQARHMQYRGRKVRVAVTRDITERKRAEEALRQSEGRWRSLVENAPDIILTVDREGTIEFINRPPAGLSVEDVLGTSALDYVVPEYREVVRQSLGRVFETGSPDCYEISARGPHDSTSWYSTCVGPIKHNGEVVAAMLITRDISEGKRAEEALRDSEFKFRTLFDSSPQAIALTEFQTGKLVDVNVKFCELTKYATEEIMGRTTIECEFYSEADRARFIDEFQGAGEVLGLEMDFKAKDGSTLHTQMFSRVIQIGNKELLLTMFLDMTEQKRLEVQLEQAQKMEAIGTLSGGIAHDFNNLLTGIQGNVSLMLMNLDLTHPHYERLMNIEKQVQSGANLTSHLLGYARKGRYEVKPIDLNRLVEDTSETFGRTRKQITLSRELVGDLFAIEADQGQIEQVLWNLFVNAADAMPGGGDLILKTMNINHNDMKGKLYDPKPGNYVLLTVTDTGTGMYKKTMERIFDPFFTTKEMGRGTGLGLASAYGIIKAHAGYIDVESKKGHGTTFSIYLPASEKEVQKVVTSAEKVIEGTETVLLVDDEEVILEVGRELLEAMGYRVVLARDGKEAIEVYKKNWDEIDTVVLDMVMPYMGGGEAYDKMKEINPKVKVLLSSGYSIDGQAKEILERGCDAFIQKPFGMQELSQKIREVLEKK